MIIENAIRCNSCGNEIESNHRHDYVQCRCGACAADGAIMTFAVDSKRKCAIRTFQFVRSHQNLDQRKLIKPHLHSLSL